MPNEPQKGFDEEDGPEMSWSKYHKLARKYADAQYGLRRVPVDKWKEYWATGVPFTHAARLINESRNPRY